MFLHYYEVEWGGIIIRKACVCVGGGCHDYVLMTIDVKISEESGGSIEESVGEVLCGNPLYLE